MKMKMVETMMVLGFATVAGLAPVDAQEAKKGKGMTSEEMAKAKNVPATIEDPKGDYQLVTVIESAEANRKLTQNLQVVGAQRQRLLALSQQFDRLPANAFSQRELVAEEILKVRQTLTQNLRFMAKAYSYSVQLNYRLVPHAATLLEVSIGEDKKVETEVVQEFKTAKSYEKFQKMREDYIIQTLAEVKEANVANEGNEPAVEGGEPGVIADEVAGAGADAPDFKPSDALVAKGRELKALYGFDPMKDYQINLEKTALYARPAGR